MIHHANLYIATQFDPAFLPEHVQMPGADVSHAVIEAFGIADARQLTSDASVRPVEAAKRSFVLHFNTITVEAQNALLKLFEDPPETSEFFVVIPRESLLLPTLRSRLNLVRTEAGEGVEQDVFHSFQKLSYKDRLDLIAEKIKKKDVSWIDTIHAGLLSCDAGGAEEKGIVLMIDTNLRRRGGSKKMLLEALALSLPLGR